MPGFAASLFGMTPFGAPGPGSSSGPPPATTAVVRRKRAFFLLAAAGTSTVPAAPAWTPTGFDPGLVAYLSGQIGRQVYATLRKGFKYRAPINVSGDPIVTYCRINDHRPLLLAKATGIVEAYYQIDVFSGTLDAALVVEEQIRQALQGYTGSFNGSEVMATSLFDQAYAWLENADPKLVGVYRIMSEYRFTYRESVRVFA